MHIKKYDRNYSRRHFLETVSKGAMGAGVLGLFAPSDKIALGDSVALFALGAIIWVTGIMLHALNERSRPDTEE